MLQADWCYHRDFLRLEDIGAVHPPAEAHLDHLRLHVRLTKGEEAERRQQVERHQRAPGVWRRLLDGAAQRCSQPCETLRRDKLAVYPHTLAIRVQVRAGVKSGPV